MTHNNAADCITMHCSSDPCTSCDNCDERNAVKSAAVCDQCNQHHGMAVRWIIRNQGWAMPIEWASAKACLDAFAGDHERHFAVAEFYAVLMRATPIFAGCNFSTFARYMHALLLHAREISGGFFLSGDWERARRCTDWCGHVATADCSKQCSDVMREVSNFRLHGYAPLALAGGVLSVFSATRRAAKAEASTIVQDILSINPMAYALYQCRRMREVYGVNVNLDSRVMKFLIEGGMGFSSGVLLRVPTDFKHVYSAPDQGAIPSTSRGTQQKTPATSQAAE
jgi:hypothetical protein